MFSTSVNDRNWNEGGSQKRSRWQALYSPLCLRPCNHLLCHLDLAWGGFWTYSFVASKSWLSRLFGNRCVFEFAERMTQRS